MDGKLVIHNETKPNQVITPGGFAGNAAQCVHWPPGINNIKCIILSNSKPRLPLGTESAI